MDEFLDEGIGSNIRLLPDFYRSLKREETVLNGQLIGDSSLGNNEWLKVSADIHDTISHLESLHGELKAVAIDIIGVQESNEGVVSDVIGTQETISVDDSITRRTQWREESGKIVKGVTHFAEEISELDCLESYITWLRHINYLSCMIEKFAGSDSPSTTSSTSAPSSSTSTGSDAVEFYLELLQVSSKLEATQCHELKKWAMSVKNHGNTILKLKLTSSFSSLLTSLLWPLSSSAISSRDLNRWDEDKGLFSELFINLMKLDTSHHNGDVVKTHDMPLPLPLEVMVSPLRKRFRYHFMENRKTNNPEKPEWYLTQVSNWLRDHAPILEQNVQPILDDSIFSHINAKLEFSRGLLQEVVAKLEWDMKEMSSQDSIMAHLIDELLLFERELYTIIPFPTSHSDDISPWSVLHVLLDEVPFDKWRNLEKSYAVERLKEITSSEVAWLSPPPSEVCMESDEIKVPQCTEQLMILIKGITERYRPLPSKRHQLLFLELQVDLLLEFHQDLSQAVSRTHPLDPHYSAYLNASYYINTVLVQWGKEKFFQDLVCYSRHAYSDVQIPANDSKSACGEDSVFDAVNSSFSSLVNDMQNSITLCIVEESRQLSLKYKTEKWHNMKLYGDEDILSMELSYEAARLLTSLRDHFLLLENSISSILFPIVMEKISEGLDDVILNEVILASHFNGDGVRQLKYDISQYFIPLVARHCDQVIQKKIFVKTLEALSVLSLLPGTSLLLSSLLSEATSTPQLIKEQALVDADEALHNVGVFFLTYFQAKQILKNRIYDSI